ncbi:MAG TPA: outer membrane protein assembly factor BamD [Cytophagaceae bacterium]|jgi:outer membrane protein assembly factor BamD
MPKSLYIIFLALQLLVISSCSKFSKLQKSDDINAKLAAAIKYYEDEDYYKANVLFEEIVPLLKGRQEAEKAQYYQAYNYYKDKQYILSAYHFKDFIETYPRSEYTEECSFLHAKSLYNDSPVFELDQTNTDAALVALQRFTNNYPKSTYLEEANRITDELNKKIELKTYENAKVFHKIGNHKSAVVTLTSFQEKYPESVYGEEVAYLKLDAQFRLAILSVEGAKKKERYYDAIEFYHNFIDKYPESKYKRVGQTIYDQCLKQIAKYNS